MSQLEPTPDLRIYEVTVVERWRVRYRVAASCYAEAVEAIESASGLEVAGTREFIERDKDCGMSSAEKPEVFAELVETGIVEPDAEYLPAIDYIEDVTEELSASEIKDVIDETT